jgi:mRNA-degrading endonuclease RelE of RelBE toxin-antitoxin system
MEYRLLIDIEVIEILDRLPKRVRYQLLNQLHRIRSFPSNYSDYNEQDAVGRRVEICIVSRWAIHYWIDSADRHVKVLALKAADK